MCIGGVLADVHRGGGGGSGGHWAVRVQMSIRKQWRFPTLGGTGPCKKSKAIVPSAIFFPVLPTPKR